MTRVEISPNQGHSVWYVPISVSSGTTELVAPVRRKSISVISYVLVASSAGTAKFVDSTGDLTGDMSFAANGGISAPGQASSPWFAAGVGEALSITTTAPFEGHLAYTC